MRENASSFIGQHPSEKLQKGLPRALWLALVGLLCAPHSKSGRQVNSGSRLHLPALNMALAFGKWTCMAVARVGPDR